LTSHESPASSIRSRGRSDCSENRQTWSVAGLSAEAPRLVEERKLVIIEKQIGRTLAEAPKKSRETTFGAAEVLTLALTVGFAAFCVAITLLMTAII
jgi:hypothetical protein